MARRRFFVPEIRRGTAELTGVEAEHLVRVLRVEAGQVYELSDNQQVYLAEIEMARKAQVTFRILEKLPVAEAGPHICLVPALFKFDRFEVLVEKATELGVEVIQPFESARTDRGLAQAAIKRIARWEKIALEASQQSRRVTLPQLRQPLRFAQAIKVEASVRLFLDEETAPAIGRQLTREGPGDSTFAIMLGPEGGWTDEERRGATDAGWLSCSLGPTILRAETAGIAALAVIQTAWSQQRREPDPFRPEAS